MRIFIFIFCLFSTLSVKTDPESLALILKDFKEYRPSAYWITHDFYNLDADEFYEAFAKMIELFSSKEKLTLYFDIHESEAIDPYFFRDKILWQCKNYQSFIVQTVVDVQTKKLRRAIPGQQLLETEISLEDYGNHMYPDEWINLQLFYCCYLDALSHYMHEIISYEESPEKFAELAPVAELFKEYTLKITEPKKVKKYRTALKNFLEIQENYALKLIKKMIKQ